MALSCGMLRKSRLFVAPSWTGMIERNETSPGVGLETHTIYGSVKSCYNKPRFRLLFPITSAFQTGSQQLRIWPKPQKRSFSKLGRDQVTIHVSETCKRLRNKSWMTLMVSFQIHMKTLPNSRASDPILLVLFLALLLGSQNLLLMVMLCGLWLVSLRLTTISETPKIVRFSKRLWTF